MQTLDLNADSANSFWLKLIDNRGGRRFVQLQSLNTIPVSFGQVFADSTARYNRSLDLYKEMQQTLSRTAFANSQKLLSNISDEIGRLYLSVQHLLQFVQVDRDRRSITFVEGSTGWIQIGQGIRAMATEIWHKREYAEYFREASMVINSMCQGRANLAKRTTDSSEQGASVQEAAKTWNSIYDDLVSALGSDGLWRTGHAPDVNNAFTAHMQTEARIEAMIGLEEER